MRGWPLFESLRNDFVGFKTHYPLADGRFTQRHYLDSAASTLALRPAQEVAQAFLQHYANTHSQLHYAARIASATYHWAHQQVLQFCHAAGGPYTCFFTGSGATAGLNRLARILAAQRPQRDVVLVSQMEHHSNDLPHRKHAAHCVSIPLQGEPPGLGQIDLIALEQLLKEYGERVNYVAVTAASNVTGIINPIHDIAELAHAFGAWIVVDGSQIMAHAPVHVGDPAHPERDLDFLVFSGHKLYAPTSPGVVVASRALLENWEPDEVGGGTVDQVYLEHYQITPYFPEREEAGTPNIVGAVLLATVLEILQRIGMERVHQAETQLVRQTLDALARMPEVTVYGPVDQVPRTGTIAFNVAGLDHGLVAAVLNDYHNVAVRNECFCAHPYVREMLKPELWALDIDPDADDALGEIKRKQGMVRASLGLYSNAADIDALLTGLGDLIARREHYKTLYQADSEGNYRHKTFVMPATDLFDPLQTLDTLLP
jgi:selenocysteine lyase/cysteine desulfurase